jgi:lactoylglutathione lyase
LIDSVAGCMAVYVRNREEALRFYVDTLGFEFREGPADITLPGTGTCLRLVQPDEAGLPESVIGGETGVVFRTAEIQDTYEELSEKGVRFLYEPTLKRWDITEARFADPDGNRFLLVKEWNGQEAG